jgi:hypothetical protein
MLERYKIFIVLVALFMGQFLFAADNIWLTDLATAKSSLRLKSYRYWLTLQVQIGVHSV